MFTVTLLSVAKKQYKDKNTGADKQYWMCYAADAEGNIGGIYSDKERKTGEKVNLALSVNRDGRFAVRIAE